MQTEIKIQETEAGANFLIYDEGGKLVARSVIFKTGADAQKAAGGLVQSLRGAVTIKGGARYPEAKAGLIIDSKGRRKNAQARGEAE